MDAAVRVSDPAMAAALQVVTTGLRPPPPTRPCPSTQGRPVRHCMPPVSRYSAVEVQSRMRATGTECPPPADSDHYPLPRCRKRQRPAGIIGVTTTPSITRAAGITARGNPPWSCWRSPSRSTLNPRRFSSDCSRRAIAMEAVTTELVGKEVVGRRNRMATIMNWRIGGT